MIGMPIRWCRTGRDAGPRAMLGVGNDGPEKRVFLAVRPCNAKDPSAAFPAEKVAQNGNAAAQFVRVGLCNPGWQVKHQVRSSSIGSGSVASASMGVP